MPSSPKHRAFLPACLTLGALLCSLPAFADSPAAPTAGAAQAQSITLQHTIPGDILKALHWDQSAQQFDSVATIHVEGVTRISAQPATNSLSVVATPTGLAKVKQMVKLLDIAQRQVQIKMALAHVTDADLKASGVIFESAPLPSLLTVPMPDTRYATGNEVALLLQTLTKQGSVIQTPVITTTNNVAASITLVTTFSSQVVSSQMQVVSSEMFAVTPRVNSDDSVTLALHPVFQDGAAKREIKTLRTVQNGGTMVLVMPASAPKAGSDTILLFVTPTILPTDRGTAAMTVK